VSHAVRYFDLLPAVDVKDGRAVRLVQGELSAETTFGNPLEVALEFQAAGAKWIHLVDLDAAFARGENSALLARVVEALDIDVQLSGGIRDDQTLERALATGCRRINLATTALESPEWVARMIAKHGEKIAVSLDVRGNVLAARGGTQVGGDLMQTLEMLEREGCQRYIVTDVTKDGTLQGPNISLLREVCAKTKSPVIASGGVSTLEDIASLASLDIEGAIVGKALYAGAFTLQQALELTNTLAHSGGQ
jgi:1-(5-phosphoribosyl)-5-[(5-phosphoribosylamino)methylideneamino] imidazole-4-carboxamide isomerase/N-(5'phosphoribosyl)anthranilate isomerase